MKKWFLLLKYFVPAVMLAMVSCNKEELPDPTMKKIAFFRPEAVLKEVQVSQINNNGHVYDFSYGTNGNLEQVSGFYQSSPNEEGNSYKVEEDYKLLYEGDRLKGVNKDFTYTRYLADGTQELESSTTRVDYLYNEKGLIGEVQKTFLYNLPGEITFSHQYEYNNESKVVKITVSARGEVSSDYNILEWNEGNIVKQTLFFTQQGEGQRKLRGNGKIIPESNSILRMLATGADETGEEVVFSEYDDKMNPMMLFAVIFGESPGMTKNENNAGKIVNYRPHGNGNLIESQITTISHTYDSQGRPVHYKVSTTSHELNQTYDNELSVTYRD